MAASVKEAITLTQALIKKDDDLDVTLQPSTLTASSTAKHRPASFWMKESNSVLSDDSSSSEEWNPDEDSSTDDEQKIKWYSKLVRDHFVGSIENFKKARELYRISQHVGLSSVAVFYKLKDKQKVSDDFTRARTGFARILTDSLQHTDDVLLSLGELKEQLNVRCSVLIDPEDSLLKQIIINVLKTNELYEKLGTLPKEKLDIATINDILKEFEGIVLAPLYKEFFKINMSQAEMKTTSALYCPDVQHCWCTNLSWELGHVQKGSKFLICSDILSNVFRRTKGSETEYTAFLREICVALKAGYSLCKNADGITLQPICLSPEHLLSCDSTGASGDGINPSFKEIEQIYQLLRDNGLDSNQEFQCHFDFSNGLVEFVKGPKVLAELSSRAEVSHKEASGQKIEPQQSQTTSMELGDLPPPVQSKELISQLSERFSAATALLSKETSFDSQLPSSSTAQPITHELEKQKESSSTIPINRLADGEEKDAKPPSPHRSTSPKL